MDPFHRRRRHRAAAFTMVELLTAACISSVLGLAIYTVASEGVIAFARNISINRSYSNARQTLDRIAINLQSAGHTPILVGADGTDLASQTAGTSAAGIRFWRYGSTPAYYITTPASISVTQLTLSLVKPGTTSTVISPPAVGDMITVAALGFQAQATGVTVAGTGATSTATVSYSGTLAGNTPAASPLTAAGLTAASTTKINGVATPVQFSCLAWTPVAFIAVSSQLRYYPRFVSGTTAVNTAANYKVLTYLSTGTPGTAALYPFALGQTPTVNVDLYAEAPDYNNRTSLSGTTNNFNGLNSANIYTYLQTGLAPRNPLGLIRSP